MAKICKKCGIAKTELDFYAHATNKDRLMSSCKECFCKQAKNYPIDRRREVELKRRYGLTSYQNEVLWLCQGGSCGICGLQVEDEGFMHVDHDHRTGKIRGLLCQKCNLALGLLQDNPIIAQSLLEWIDGEI